MSMQMASWWGTRPLARHGLRFHSKLPTFCDCEAPFRGTRPAVCARAELWAGTGLAADRPGLWVLLGAGFCVALALRILARRSKDRLALLAFATGGGVGVALSWVVWVPIVDWYNIRAC